MNIPPLNFSGVNLVPFADVRTEAAVFLDARKPVTGRLGALENLGCLLSRSHENGDDFLYGVTALFDLAARPRASGDAATKLRHRALLILDAALNRRPTDPPRIELVMHAFLNFQDLAERDLKRACGKPAGTQDSAIASAEQSINFKLSADIIHCSPAIQKYDEEASDWRTPRSMNDVPACETFLLSTFCTVWAGIFYLLSPSIASVLLKAAGVIFASGIAASGLPVLKRQAEHTAWRVRHRLFGPKLQPYPLEEGRGISRAKLLPEARSILQKTGAGFKRK